MFHWKSDCQSPIICGRTGKALWLQVGESLKAVDARSLLATWTEWSEGYASSAKCAEAWDSLPPRTIRAAVIQVSHHAVSLRRHDTSINTSTPSESP